MALIKPVKSLLPGQSLALAYYAPSVLVQYAAPSSGATSAIDINNLAVTFTVPANGRVKFVLTGEIYWITTVVDSMSWGVKMAGGTQIGPLASMNQSPSRSPDSSTFTASILSTTELTPGATATVQWIFGNYGTSAGGYVYAGNGLNNYSAKGSPASIEAIAA